LSKKTILIVEDEEAILMALQRILELTGKYEAITAQDGTIALDKIKSIIPDLIISDISMPNMNGLDFCRKVRENPLTKSVPFVFLTGKKEKLVESLNAGGDDFLMKPFNVEEVLVKIETIFRRVDQSREQASQHKGRIEEMAVEEILQLCLRERISGELVLQNEGNVGVVGLENGDITSVKYDSLKDDAALDIMREWKRGTFVIRPSDIKFKMDTHPKVAEVDLNAAQQLTENVWWVGSVDEETNNQTNIYLRIFESDAKRICTVIDPGSPLRFSEISDKLASVIEDIANINIYIPMESEPDVCLNSLFLRKANPRVICMTSAENWEMIKHYEINPKSVKKIDLENSPVVGLASGHHLQFIPTPFCRTASAFMTYDPEKKILFSGALFSAQAVIGREKSNTVYAVESDWEDMRSFHQKYIPGNLAMMNVINILKTLKPKPEIIAPRYGKIIKAELIDFFTERLKLLHVGVDKRYFESLDQENSFYLKAVNMLLNQIQGEIPMEKSLKKIKKDAQLSALCAIDNARVASLSGDGGQFYLLLIKVLMSEEDHLIANHVKTSALKIAYSLGLPVPEL